MKKGKCVLKPFFYVIIFLIVQNIFLFFISPSNLAARLSILENNTLHYIHTNLYNHKYNKRPLSNKPAFGANAKNYSPALCYCIVLYMQLQLLQLIGCQFSFYQKTFCLKTAIVFFI